jgi:uncharacterized protein with FMN-binding domain
MRRILLWALTTVSTVVLLFGYRTSTSTTLPAGVEAAGSTPGTTPSTITPPTTTPSTTTRTTTSTYTGMVTGTTADTRWGPVQVRATLAAGRITAVDVVQYPTANHKDQEINADAIPTLVQETLEVQSADIDVVSGATVTSDGYLESLQSVLDQAGVA